MNAGGQRGVALDFRQWVAAEQYRKEAERARETAKLAVSARDRAFWLALAANWEKLAKDAGPRSSLGDMSKRPRQGRTGRGKGGRKGEAPTQRLPRPARRLS